MTWDIVQPPGWRSPVGYANGIAATPGRLVFIAGQVGWDAGQRFASADLVPQFEQALRNVLAVLAAAGGRAEHIARLTAYCCDKAAYVAARPELGRVWRRLMGQHYPAMSLVFVADLLDAPAKIELEATAVIPPAPGPKRRRRSTRRAAAGRGDVNKTVLGTSQASLSRSP